MLENDDYREFTYPEIFNGDTPALAMVQSAGNRKDTSEPDVGRDSIRTSNGFVDASGTCTVANQLDSAASHAHSEVYSYWNLPAPASDDGDGVRASRGIITLIPNGCRITNNSAYTTENHAVHVTLMGGTDIASAHILKQTFASEAAAGFTLLPNAGDPNVFYSLTGGGAKETVYNGAFTNCRGWSYTIRANRGTGLSEYVYTHKATIAQELATSAVLTANYNTFGFNTQTAIGFNEGMGDMGQAQDANLMEPATQIFPDRYRWNRIWKGSVYNNYVPATLPDDDAWYVETTNIQGETNSVSTNYVLCLDFNDDNTNIGAWASNTGNPATANSDFKDTPQGNPVTPYSTIGEANEFDAWTVFGPNSDHHPNTIIIGNGRYNTKPVTVGHWLQSQQASNDYSGGVSQNYFHFDGRKAVDTTSNSGTDEIQGYGMGYAYQIGAAAAGDVGGAPDTFVFYRPELYASLDRDLESYDQGAVTAVRDVTINTATRTNPLTAIVAGDYVGGLNDNDNSSGGGVTVTVDGSGAITDVAANGTGLYYQYNDVFVVTLSVPGFSSYKVNVTVDGIDDLPKWSATGGRAKIGIDMDWETDGGITMQPFNGGVLPAYSFGTCPQVVFVLASSDGLGTGDGGGGDAGDFTGNVFFGAANVNSAYYGTTSVTSVYYGTTRIV